MEQPQSKSHMTGQRKRINQTTRSIVYNRNSREFSKLKSHNPNYSKVHISIELQKAIPTIKIQENFVIKEQKSARLKGSKNLKAKM